MNIPKIIDGGLNIDDRGSITFVNGFDFKGVKRFYMLQNHRQGFIRAWRGHRKEGKYLFIVNGTALVGAVNLKSEEVYKFILSSKKPSILWIPPGYANGFKNLEENTRIIFFSTSTTKDSQEDDIKFPYDKWNIWGEDFR